MQDVQHCFEISSHTMSRLYNTAGISSAAATATATAALPAAVRSPRRLPQQAIFRVMHMVWRRIKLEVYRNHHVFPLVVLPSPGIPEVRYMLPMADVFNCKVSLCPGLAPFVQNTTVLFVVIHGRAHPARVQPVPLAKTARTLTIPAIPKCVFKYLHT